MYWEERIDCAIPFGVTSLVLFHFRPYFTRHFHVCTNPIRFRFKSARVRLKSILLDRTRYTLVPANIFFNLHFRFVVEAPAATMASFKCFLKVGNISNIFSFDSIVLASSAKCLAI